MNNLNDLERSQGVDQFCQEEWDRNIRMRVYKTDRDISEKTCSCTCSQRWFDQVLTKEE